MCGIAGIVPLDGNPDRLRLARLCAMRDVLAHRGPDASGIYVDEVSHGVGLAHRRLSILDLARGRQPLANEDATVFVTFNGEIFNHADLRRSLMARGHCFSTRTDTEVLVHLYEEYGDAFVHELNGQFAFALWDSRRRRLLLVRDRPGILPLYYTEQPGEVLFASEIKSILAVLPSIPPPAADALRDVMTLWAPLSPSTLFTGIFEVEPGQMLIVERGRVARHRYWQWRMAPPEEQLVANEGDRAEELHALLADAVDIRLQADVPVGAFLSGGLDSSVVTSLIAQDADQRLRTFSLGFEDGGIDESGYQQMMASTIRGERSQVLCTPGDISARFRDVIRAAEVPFTRSGPIAMHALSEHVHGAGYKVVLTGEGADEVLGGYDLFKEAKVRAFCARQPASTRRPRLLQRLYRSFEFTRAQPAALLSAYFAGHDHDVDDPVFSHRVRWNTGAVVEQFLAPEFRAHFSAETPVDRTIDRFRPELAGLDLVQRAQVLESRILLPNYILCSQSDRMLMAHSVEGRFPYLDHRVIEFANRLPLRLKVRGLVEKPLLKRVARGRVPAPIIDRPKQAYRGPDATAFLGAHRPDWLPDLLAPSLVARFGYFEPTRVEWLLRKLDAAARAGAPVSPRDNLSFLTILSTQMWHALFQAPRGGF
jgi:asparagine synthase (glutamine-hydrolysing)